MPPSPSLVVWFGIPAVALAVVIALGFAIHAAAPPADRRRHLGWYALAAAAYLVVTAIPALTGVLARDAGPPPPMLLILVPTLAVPWLLAFSRLGDRLVRLPVAWLIGLHAFRLPLELVMHQAAVEGTMPQQMTYTGVNFDIVTGISAIVVAALAAGGRAPRWLIVAWNLLGTALLVAIGAIAIASLPQFHAFGTAPHQVNTWVAYFPFQWLPAVMVAGATLGHLVLWRALLSSQRKSFDKQAALA